MSSMDFKEIPDDSVKIYVPGRLSAKIIEEPKESEEVKIYSGKIKKDDPISSPVQQL